MLEFRVLGTLELATAFGTPLAAVRTQPKRVALLTYLALARPSGAHTRDHLLALLWPELDESHARAALRQAIHHLRHELGEQAIITSRFDELRFNPESISCDAICFEAQLDASHHESALALYRGDLLEGFFVTAAPGFEEWLERERARLRARAANGAWTLAELRARGGNVEEAASWGTRALALSHDDEMMLQRLLRLLEQLGDRVRAVREYDAFVRRLRREYEMEPSTETRRIMDAIRLHISASHAAPPAPALSASSAVGGTTTPSPPSTAVVSASAVSDGRQARWVRRRRAGTTAVLSLVPLLLWALWDRRSATTARFSPHEIVLPNSAPVAFLGAAHLGVGRVALALSPDGKSVVYVARNGDDTQLYLTRKDQPVLRPLAGTEGAFDPFFSPDGRWVAFFAGNELKKVSIPEGHVVILAQVDEAMGGSWSADGSQILVADDEGTKVGWIAGEGGPLQRVGRLDVRYTWLPQLLPGDQWILHSSADRALYVTSLVGGKSMAITRHGTLVRRDSVGEDDLLRGDSPRYLARGYITYLDNGTLMALRFDGVNRRVLGTSMELRSGVRTEGGSGAGQYVFAPADSGTLLYAPGEDATLTRFVWTDSTGRIEDTLPFAAERYGSFQLSPDGHQILVRVETKASRAELWVLDLGTKTHTVIETGGTPFFLPTWWPDGKRIILSDQPAWWRGTRGPLLRRSEDGGVDTLVPSAALAVPSPDGDHFAVAGVPGDSGLSLRSLTNSAQRVQLSAGFRSFASFSPDGRWIVVMNHEPTQDVYVIDTRHLERGQRKISEGGGIEPRWPSPGLIVYRKLWSWWAVAVDTLGDTLSVKPARKLFSGPFVNVPGWSHDVSADGKRHLLLFGRGGDTTHRLTLVKHWYDELRGTPHER